jgi:hypothetical protein
VEVSEGISGQNSEIWRGDVHAKFREIPEAAADCSARQHPSEPSVLADEFLRAVGAGDDRAAELAADLANAVLEASGARLALSVLEGGALTVTRAIRLAEKVLSSHVDPACAGVW